MFFLAYYQVVLRVVRVVPNALEPLGDKRCHLVSHSRLSRIYANCRSLLAGDFKVRIACKQAPTPIT
jgi:hypothetical protein